MKTKSFFSMLALLAATVGSSPASSAQTFSVVKSFGKAPDPSGAIYGGAIAQGRDGNLYTTSSGGGKLNDGAVYKITPAGAVTVLYSFDSVHGRSPRGGLTLGADGNFYGTTEAGGANAYGTVFKITPAGAMTVLHNFVKSEGGEPYGPPVLAGDGNYYGTTSYYGAHYYGSIYRITPTGAFSVLFQFGTTTGASTTGGSSLAPLTLGRDGYLYGTASAGGKLGNGCVFKISTSGAFSIVYNFASDSGDAPYSAVSFGADGAMYGSTPYGGANSRGVAFRLTTAGAYKVLHSFGAGTTDGKSSYSGLVPASDGNFYGNLSAGGSAADAGTLFSVTATGTYTTQHTFNGTDGKLPESAMVQLTNGTLYGQTFYGGTSNLGEVFSLNRSLKAFVKPMVPFGKVGATVQILGQGFVAGSTTVSFGGKAATSVSIVSANYLTAVVPSGALTGVITVKTGAVSLTSIAPFNVTPTVSSFTPGSGPVGAKVVISGVSLGQATAVKFGTLAGTQLTIISDSQVSAMVPSGAKTGKITVVTKGGSATSSGTFTVN